MEGGKQGQSYLATQGLFPLEENRRGNVADKKCENRRKLLLELSDKTRAFLPFLHHESGQRNRMNPLRNKSTERLCPMPGPR